MTTDQKALLPCPFCGGKAIYCSAEGDLYIQHFIACDKCGCEGKPSTGKRHAERLWNTRSQPMAGLVEKLEIIASGGIGQYQWSMTKAEVIAREALELIRTHQPVLSEERITGLSTKGPNTKEGI